MVALQRSFLDAWLHGKDDRGWLQGPNASIPAVSVTLRKGKPPHNDIQGDRSFPHRQETEWPIARTRYIKYHLSSDLTMSTNRQDRQNETNLEYEGLSGEAIQFATAPFDVETEYTGHVLAKLVVSADTSENGTPRDMDVFVTLRHLDEEGNEIYYTGGSCTQILSLVT